MGSAMIPLLVLGLLPFAIPAGSQAAMAPLGKPHWGCGSVSDMGTTWNPEGSMECGGNSAILAHGGAGKCWLRKKVDLPKCQINADYDYYLYDLMTKNYRKIDHHNCFAWHGADPSYGHDTLFLNLGACKNKCKNEEECEGFVMESQESEKTDAAEMEVESCWLLKGVITSNCQEGASGFSVMMHDSTNPGDFSLQFPDMRCYAFKGADSTYGQTPLKFADGEKVTHLGDCKAACHTDDSCEAIQIASATGGEGSTGAMLPAEETAPGGASSESGATAAAPEPTGDAPPPAMPLSGGENGTGASNSTDEGAAAANNTDNGSTASNSTGSNITVLPDSTSTEATTPTTPEASAGTTTLMDTTVDSGLVASNASGSNATDASGMTEPATAPLVVTTSPAAYNTPPISYNPVFADDGASNDTSNGTSSNATAGSSDPTTTDGLAADNGTGNDSDAGGAGGANATRLFEERLGQRPHGWRSEVGRLHSLLAGFTCLGLVAALTSVACVRLRSGRRTRYRSVAQKPGALLPSGVTCDDVVEA